MVELSLMASAAKSPPILVPDQVLHRGNKGLQVLLPLHGNKLFTLRSSSLNFNLQHPEDLRRPANLLSDCISSDSRLDYSLLFSWGIAEKCSMHERVIKFLMSGSDLAEREDLDISLLSELMGLKPVALDMQPQPNMHCEEDFCTYDIEMDDSQQVLIPKMHLFVPEPDWDCFGNFSPTSGSTNYPDGRLIFERGGLDAMDILSASDEFSVPKAARSMVVPYFTRKGQGRSKAKNQVSSKQVNQVVSPLKSTSDIKLKPAHKRRNKKVANQMDLYDRNYFHACECLMSFVLDKNKEVTMASLKKSCPEISLLLTKFSAGIAGTGLAIIFSVFFKSAYGKVPLCSSRLLNTGLGFGLFWLSSAICKLRDTIMMISNNSSKQKLNEEELAGKVDKSMKEIMFRAAAIVAVGVLRLA